MSEFYFLFGEEPVAIADGEKLTVGRTGYGADLEIDDPSSSRRHAELERRQDKLYIKDTESLNGVYLNNERIEQGTWQVIAAGDSVKILNKYIHLPAALVSDNDTYAEPSTDSVETEIKTEARALQDSNFRTELRSKRILRVGRNEDNDIVLPDPTVSRYHAEISFEDGSYYVKDLDSLNGTYLNGQRIKTRREFRETDVIVVALHSFSLKEGWIDLRRQRSAIVAKNIHKQYPNKKVGLQPLSVEIPYSNFVALMGPSGCGKSTLLKCLNGDNPASSGEVLIHGLGLKQNFNLLKRKIGYVPQDDIIHSELTVEKTLYYAAKLRLPDDTSDQEIQERITKVINSLNLDQDKEKDIREVVVKDLSGGQRKRVSIAVELLVEPTILFLDEPTSPLDPESIDSFLRSLQKLAKEGTTIIMVTHKPEDLNYVDNVIFLMIKGYLSYYGRAQDLLYRFEVDDIVQVYAKLSDKGRLQEHIDKYYIRPLERDYHQGGSADDVEKDKQDSLLLQFFWLFKRYLRIKISDRSNLILLLSQPVIIGGLICLIFDELQLGVLFLMAISAIWFGVSNAAKEIVGELPIYRRERMFNLNIHTYVLSKWGVLSLVAFVQTFIFVAIIYIKFRSLTMEGYEEVYLKSFGSSFFFVFYMAVSATLIGLWLSSYFNTTERVMTVVPIALMPQIMLAGVITRIDNLIIELASFLTIGRWGTEGLARIQDNAYDQETTSQVASVLRFVPKLDSVVTQTGDCQCTSMVSSSTQMEVTGTKALGLLDFYNEQLITDNKLIGSLFNSMNANLLIVLVLDALLYLMIYYSLKRKDSI